MDERAQHPGGPLLAWTTLRQAISLIFEFSSAFFLAGLIWWLALPTLVLIGPVTAMLYRLGAAAVEGRIVAVRDFPAAMRGTWPWSTIHSLAWLAGWLLILVNVRFYRRISDSALISLLEVAALLLWSGVGFFLFPAALAQERPRLRRSLPAALRLLARRPGTMLGVGIFGSVLLLISVLLPILLLLLPGALAVWSQALVMDPAGENNG